MAEAAIRRFRGFATNLPDTNNSAFAEDVRNVYEKTPGELVRREGCRRAIEYKADGPIWMIVPIVEPGGGYTGSGLDVLLQAGGDLVGESSPRSTIVPSTTETPEGGAPVDYSLAIDSLEYIAWLFNRLVTFDIVGRNFDNEAGNPLTVSIRNNTTGLLYSNIPTTQYLDPGRVRVVIFFAFNAVVSVGHDISVTVTNPNGQSKTYNTVVEK